MQDAELFAFMAIFRGLLRMFPKRLEESEITDLGRDYFTGFRRFTIPQLEAGAEIWKQRGKYFPKPAEWRECIPRDVSQHVALVELTPNETREYLDAERKHFEDEPCDCRRCQDFGVTHRFLRYVPESDEFGNDARGLIGTRSVVRGHWAHGDELARWYAAQERFWLDFRATVARLSMPKGKAVEPEPEAEEVA